MTCEALRVLKPPKYPLVTGLHRQEQAEAKAKARKRYFPAGVLHCRTNCLELASGEPQRRDVRHFRRSLKTLLFGQYQCAQRRAVVRTSVYDWRAFPFLCHDVQLTGDLLGGKPSAVCQPT